MNPWVDFFLTAMIRFIAGAIIGCIVSFVLGFRTVMRAISESSFPIERFLVWGIIGGIICMLATPREHWPWSSE